MSVFNPALKLILVWTPGKESPIHDHAGSRCVMKVRRYFVEAECILRT